LAQWAKLMSDKITVLSNALWIAHPVILAGIAVVMFRRKLQKKFKFFFQQHNIK